MVYMSRRKILLLFAAFLLSGFFIFSRNLFAQAQGIIDKKAITISPLVFDLEADPGEILENELRIYNSGDQKILVEMKADTFVPVGEEGSVQIVDLEAELEGSYSLKKWIKIEPDIFELEPRQEKIVNFTIDLPKNAEPGGRYGSLVATVGGEGSIIGGGGGSQIMQKVASLVLLAVAGETKENLLVKEFKGPDFQEYGPVNFVLKLENQGTIHARPKGFVAVANWQNKKIAELPIPQSAVLPGAKRTINIIWNEKNILGKFTATLVGFYGLSNTPISASWTFWVWPWKITLVILIVVILLLILLIRGRKRVGAAMRILFKGEKNSQSPVDQPKQQSPDQTPKV